MTKRIAQSEREQIIDLLKKIQKPHGVYRIDRIEYLTNVLTYCIEQATEALKLLGVSE